MKKSYKILKIKVKIRYFFRKIGLIETPIKLTIEQKKAISIVRCVANNPRSILLVDPILGTCYGEFNHYMVKLTNSSIIIKNTDFDSHINIELRLGEKLVHFFYMKVSERRIDRENIYMLKTIDKLTKIYNDINN